MSRSGLMWFCSAILVSVAVLTVPGQARAAEISVISEDFPWWHDQWVPNGGSVEINRTYSTSCDGSSYQVVSHTWAQARMYCFHFDWPCHEHAAGGYRKIGWETDLRVVGEPGEQMDVFLHGGWHAICWVERTDEYSEAAVDAHAYAHLRATRSDGSWIVMNFEPVNIRLQIGDHTCKKKEDEIWEDNQEYYLGRMTVGDTISVLADSEAYANAYLDMVGEPTTGQARTDAWFDFGIRAVTVPEPTTLSLLALGGLALIRRRRTA